MAKIKLVDTGWSMIPEGDYIFKITDVVYKEDFGKLEVKLTSQEGQTHTERYSLLTNRGEVNEGAQKAFSYFAKTALNNFNVEEIDPDDLIDCYVSATVEHVESDTISEKTGEPFINVRLNDLKSATGFKKTKAKKEAAPVEDDESESAIDDLDALLDDLDV